MHNSAYTDPNNHIDRLIYYTLSHGRKRQCEIVRILSDTRFGDESIKDNIREIEDKYDWACGTKDDNGNKYYYREDIGQEHKQLSIPADYSRVEQLLRNAEIQTGIRSRNIDGVATETSTPLPNCLQQLLEISQSKGKLFVDDELLDRYFLIYDGLIKSTKVAYPRKADRVPSYTGETYRLIFMLASDRCDKWKTGRANERFDQHIRKRLDELVELVEFVPPVIGESIFSIVATVDSQRSKEVFKKMLYSNKYQQENLVTYAKYSYIIFGETKSLLNDLAEWNLKCSSGNTRQSIVNLHERIRRQFSGRLE